MFERFTREARDAVEVAHNEASALGHCWLGTEHLLLGVAADGGRAGSALNARGATPAKLRAALVETLEEPLDADALASIGIDLEAVRRRAEAAFGPGALERGRRRPGRGSRARLTPRAKKSLELALREAIAAGDRHIGAEHVLLGVLRDKEALATRVLRRADVDVEELRDAVSPAGSRRGHGA